MKKILFVPDTISSGESGARSASQTVKILFKMGYDIGIYGSDAKKYNNKNVSLYNRKPFRMVQHFLSYKIKKEFYNVVKSFNPDFLFFAGGTINKPLAFYQLCIQKKIPFVFIDYCSSYFCIKTFSSF